MTVSLFPNIKSITGGTEADILTILGHIKAGKWKDQVQAIRQLETANEKRSLKKLLPYFTVSGTFEKRAENGLSKHSGLVCLDIDHDISKRSEIEADCYTFACFTSTGGDGLAVIVRIPTSDHNGSFRALQRYYADQFGVKVDSLPDVSRARFVSYDPDLFINQEAETFDEVWHEKAPKPGVVMPVVTYPTPTTPHSHGQAALHLAIRKILDAKDGFKHYTLNRMAFLCGGYVATGLLSEAEVVEALQAAISQQSNVESLKEAFRTIEVAVRDGFKKPILPDPMEYVARVGKRHGEPVELVSQKLAVTSGGNAVVIQKIVEQIYAEPELEIKAFWDVVYHEKKDTYVLMLSRFKYTNFLDEAGFRKYRHGKYVSVVRKSDNIVQEVGRDQIKDYVIKYLNELPFEFDNIFRSQLIDQVQKEHRILFDEGMLEFLKELNEPFVRDTKAQSFFFFRNGFVEVNKQDIVLKDYSSLPGIIWNTQVLDRDFEVVQSGDINENCDFYKFIWNISGQDKERLTALVTAIGYLLHAYKSPSNPKVIALVDEAISDEPQGGTGKGLVFQGISKLRKVVDIDGMNIDFKDKFWLQEVTEDTNVLHFNDWDGKRLSFDKLFVMSTGGMKLSKMYQGQITIPYELSPKIGISTNYMIAGQGSSHARRKFEVEIAPHYDDKFTPIDEFGHEFFSEWNEAQWSLFDNLMLHFCQIFLQGGLSSAKAVNLNRRKLLQATCTEFVNFCDELERGKEYIKKDLWDNFTNDYGFDPKQVTQVRFSRWLKTYAQLEGCELTEFRQRNELSIIQWKIKFTN
jgi:hypothetical protein